MKALLLAAGKATRLGALSQGTPKCLHQVGDEILLDRLVRQLREVGVTEFAINTHHLASQIAIHIERRPDHNAFKIIYEPSLLGTLGTLRASADFFGGESGWVLHADNFIEGDLEQVWEAFVARPRHIWGTGLGFAVDDPTNYGVFDVASDGTMVGFREKEADAVSRLASAATFAFDKRALQIAFDSPTNSSDISSYLIQRLSGRLNVVSHPYRVVDIGTPHGLRRAQTIAAQKGV